MINPPLVDAHCHLDLLKGIQKLAREEDLMGIKTITVTNSPAFYGANLNLFSAAKNIRVALGLHPELASQHRYVSNMKELIANSRFVGEIGLDGSTDFQVSFAAQLSNFQSVLEEVAKFQDKILTVHSRNAAEQTVSLLRHYLSKTANKVILHWYTGSAQTMKDAISLGYYFSVNHKMIKSRKSVALIKEIPIGRVLTETDAPFTFDRLIDNRQKSLESTLYGLALIYGQSVQDMRRKIYNNFKSLLTAETDVTH
jgi:TatD DNase family protein